MHPKSFENGCFLSFIGRYASTNNLQNTLIYAIIKKIHLGELPRVYDSGADDFGHSAKG